MSNPNLPTNYEDENPNPAYDQWTSAMDDLEEFDANGTHSADQSFTYQKYTDRNTITPLPTSFVKDGTPPDPSEEIEE